MIIITFCEYIGKNTTIIPTFGNFSYQKSLCEEPIGRETYEIKHEALLEVALLHKAPYGAVGEHCQR